MTTPSPVAHPLGPPTLNGNDITVDMMLQSPTRITQLLMDLSLQRFIADRVFNNEGGVSGGAVIFDQATENDLYLTRDVQRVAPGAEMPEVTSERPAPSLAVVEKWGGKFYITDEARDRNDAVLFTNEARKLVNTIIRKINQRAIEVLEAAIATTGGASVFPGNNWATVVPYGTSPTVPSDMPHADFAGVQLVADTREAGVVFDGWLVNPAQLVSLRLAYGDKFSGVLADNGIREMYPSNRVTAGTAYAYATGQVGGMKVEQPLATETSREGAPLMRQRTWVQSSVRPVMWVQNPYAVIKVTGLAG